MFKKIYCVCPYITTFFLLTVKIREKLDFFQGNSITTMFPQATFWRFSTTRTTIASKFPGTNSTVVQCFILFLINALCESTSFPLASFLLLKMRKIATFYIFKSEKSIKFSRHYIAMLFKFIEYLQKPYREFLWTPRLMRQGRWEWVTSFQCSISLSDNLSCRCSRLSKRGKKGGFPEIT